MVDLKTPLHINMPEKKTVDYDKSIKMFDQDDGVDHYYRKILGQCKETEEAFIFETIDPFIKSVTDVEISKEELVAAIELVRFRKETKEKYNIDIISDRINATAMVWQLNESYDRGFDDGYNKAREEIMEYISKKGE